MKTAIIHSMSRGGHNWLMNVFKSWLGSEWSFHKMEATMPDRFVELVTKNLDLPEYPNWPVYTVVRDYLNWAASYINLIGLPKGNIADPKQVMRKADIWYAIAQEAFEDTDYIPNKTIIIYDKMVNSQIYRRYICKMIGGTYNEGILNFVPAAGSSFDGTNYTGRGTEMKVLERWKWFLTEEGKPFQEYLKLRPEIMEYYLDHLDNFNNYQAEEKIHFCEEIMGKVYNNYF